MTMSDQESFLPSKATLKRFSRLVRRVVRNTGNNPVIGTVTATALTAGSLMLPDQQNDALAVGRQLAGEETGGMHLPKTTFVGGKASTSSVVLGHKPPRALLAAMESSASKSL